jgi:rSAM/selenodomain-associated transferase 1
VQHPEARILIFAKAPEPGRVKTRLIPALGPEGAAALHGELLSGVIARLAAARVAPIELWCSPDPNAAPFPRLAAEHRLACYRQHGPDLGERMAHAAADALGRGGPVVLIGTDCPPLDGDYLARALAAMADRDAVLGPAEDGGYVLLGLWRAAPELFADMPWGSDRVAALTRQRMAALGWRWAELPMLWDLDRPEDLARYRALSRVGG